MCRLNVERGLQGEGTPRVRGSRAVHPRCCTALGSCCKSGHAHGCLCARLCVAYSSQALGIGVEALQVRKVGPVARVQLAHDLIVRGVRKENVLALRASGEAPHPARSRRRWRCPR